MVLVVWESESKGAATAAMLTRRIVDANGAVVVVTAATGAVSKEGEVTC